jgi:hypothetical protein
MHGRDPEVLIGACECFPYYCIVLVAVPPEYPTILPPPPAISDSHSLALALNFIHAPVSMSTSTSTSTSASASVRASDIRTPRLH